MAYVKNRIIHRFIRDITQYLENGICYGQVLPADTQVYADYSKEAEQVDDNGNPKVGLYYVIGDGIHTYTEIRDGHGENDYNKEYMALEVGNIPEKLSELENDTGFITITDVTAKNYTTMAAVEAKGYLTSEALTDYALKTDIPSKTSELTNDSHFTTLATVAEQGYAKTSELPTKVSELENDEGYVKASAVPSKTSELTNDSHFTTLDAVAGQGYAKSTDVASTYQTKITNSAKLSADLLSEGAINKLVSTSEKTTWNNKQDTITDLDTIRSGASKGATALQPSSLTTYRTANAQDAIDATKQNIISDLEDIRANASVGAGLKSSVETNATDIATITDKIPVQASSTNKLVAKNYVDDSINNAAAYYITKNANGDSFATKAELDEATVYYSGGVVRVPTRNDYCIVSSDETHNDARTRYTYQNGQWEFQYEVNERPFTSDEVAAIDSGITKELVKSYSDHIANQNNPHKVSKTQVGLENVKNVDTTNANNISSGTLSNERLGIIPYSKLSGVASSEQGSKADTAVQPSAIADMATQTWIGQQGYLTSTALDPYAKTADVNTELAKKQNIISDLDTIRSNATAGKNASNVVATYGDIVTHNVNEFATASQGTKADSALQPAALTPYRTTSAQDEIDTAIRNAIPTNNNQLTNGAGYITTSALAPYAKSADVNTALNEKQDTLTTPQLNAVNSGITQAEVAKYDGYEATIAGLQTSKANTRALAKDLTSTTITIANALANTDYQYGTITSLTITANATDYLETNIFFTAGASITVNLPDSLKIVGDVSFDAGNQYAMSILNNALVVGVVEEQMEG